MLSLCEEPLIRVENKDGQRETLTLPGVLAALGEDRIASFIALRPHQRHPWHAFLVQVSILALGHVGGDPEPFDEAGWAAALRALTPSFSQDEPWSLIVEDLAKPAFLQPPVPEGTLDPFRNTFDMPDSLDMLVTAKNHDLKQESMVGAQPDDWLFALLSLQTQEGFLGAGNYGISRMNGGFASRPGLGFAPAGGWGARWRRDVRILRQALTEHYDRPSRQWEGYDDESGLSLVWLEPWNGIDVLERKKLHPLYIEICRRIRLVASPAGIAARQANTKAARILATEGGATGDPWTPLTTKDNKALTIPASGFNYQRMVELLPGGKTWDLPLLARHAEDERGDMVLIARSLTRGQGKTEGYHERFVSIPAQAFSLLADPENEIVRNARNRVDVIGELQQALVFAGRVLVQGGPETVAAGAARNGFVDGLVKHLQKRADATFFDDLWDEVQVEGEKRDDIHRAWLSRLKAYAQELLTQAGQGLPVPEQRRLRARVKADVAFFSTLRKKKQWQAFFASQDNRTPLEETA